MPALRTVAIMLCTCVAGLAATDSPQAPRILTVGNSFADNMVRFLPDLAKAAGLSVTIGRANVSGASLKTHWEAVEAGMSGKSADAKIYPTRPGAPKRSLEEALDSGKWDYITIQQASRLSDDAATYQPYAGRLVSYLRERSPQSVIAFHQTWAYRWDDPKFSADSTAAEMHKGIRQACRAVARELGLPIIPTGEAFELAKSRAEWNYQPEEGFDFHQRSPDRLPRQDGSLHIGWRWSPHQTTPKPRMYLDAHHASIAGSYLAGCVFFGFLFDRSPVGNTFHPPELTGDQARSLQEIAAEALEADKEFQPKQS